MTSAPETSDLEKLLQERRARNKRLLITLSIVTVLMFGFGFALVPIYNVLCAATGLNGKTNATAVRSTQGIDKTRWVTVEFLATNNATIPWQFYPMQKKVRVHPGEITRITYFAKNESPQRMVIQAIPSITPGLSAKYLKKIECFCFTEQVLNAGQSVEMPVIFQLDTSIPASMNTLTLSYTLFDRTKAHLKQEP